MARKFRFAVDRNRYVIAHAALRLILAHKLGIDASGIDFRLGRFGKPYVPDVEFNLSHSGSLALVAVGNVPLGIDVECVRPIDALQLAAHYFSAFEVQILRRLSSDRLLSGFFACWTRKEAFLKATGEGLSRPLMQFDVSVGMDALLLGTRPDEGEARRWRLHSLDVGPGYAAALCTKGTTGAEISQVDFSF